MNYKKTGIKMTLLILLVMLMLTSCIIPPFGVSDPPYTYAGDYPSLRSVAIFSLLGVSDYSSCDILVLEQDSYGRIMFAYLGMSYTCGEYDAPSEKLWKESLLAVLICQSASETTATFFDDTNYLLYRLDSEESLSDQLIADCFTEVSIADLKTRNEWNDPPSERQTVTVEANRGQKLLLEHSEHGAVRSRFKNMGRKTYYSEYAQDTNGRVLCFVRLDEWGDSTNVLKDGYLIIVEEDGKISAVSKVTDLWDYQEELVAFKSKNNWQR